MFSDFIVSIASTIPIATSTRKEPHVFFFSLAKDSTDLLIGGGNSGFSTTVRVTRVDGEQLSLPRDLPETHVS